jgi:hypothetical protein
MRTAGFSARPRAGRRRRARPRTAAIVVTHDRAEAAVVADRVALLHDGRVCRVGGVDVLERPGDAACARLLGFARVPLAAGAVAARPGDIAVGRADELLPDGHLAVAGELGRVLEFGGEVRVRVESPAKRSTRRCRRRRRRGSRWRRRGRPSFWPSTPPASCRSRRRRCRGRLWWRPRAVSSAGRAPALHAGGRRFDPVTAHWLSQIPAHFGCCVPYQH